MLKFTCILFALLTCIVLRFIQVMPVKIEANETENSPNGRYLASAKLCSNKTFWGDDKYWLEFRIIDDDKKVIAYKETNANEYSDKSNLHIKHMEWDEESEKIFFKLPDTSIILERKD